MGVFFKSLTDEVNRVKGLLSAPYKFVDNKLNQKEEGADFDVISM